MAQKQHSKKPARLSRSDGDHQKGRVHAPAKEQKSLTKLWLGLIVAVTAFLLYSNTLNHKYALDDYSLIIENSMTQKGTKALGEIFKTGYRSGYYSTDYQLYRPLSKAMFAIEWQIAPDKPALSHWINVVFFSLSCFMLFYVLSLFITNGTLIAFIAALLFAAHPIHTEIVANIKSRDEILSFLFVLLSGWGVYHYLKKNSIIYLVLAAIFFFISLLSKESAITFLAVIPLMIYFFTDSKLSKNATATLTLCFTTAIFLLIRKNILGNVPSTSPMIDNYLVGITDVVSQKATAIMLMGVYLKLLVFPHPLVSDGSYHQFPTVTAGDWQFLLPAVVYTALIVYAIVTFKQKNIFSFSILFFLITESITSNVLFLIGTNYGERLMYVPSLGFCLAAAVLIAKFLGSKVTGKVKDSVSVFLKSNTKAVGLTMVIVFLYAVKTISRNTDWYDNFSLYSKDVQTAPNSARNHFYLGNHLTQEDFLATVKDTVQKEKYKQQGIAELNKSIEIYPQYADAYHKLAKTYMGDQDYKRAEPLYLKALELNPASPMCLNNYGNLLFSTGRYEEAKEKFEKATKYNPYYAHAFNNLASVYGTYGQNYMGLAAQNEKNGDQQAAKKNRQLAIDSFNSAVLYFQQAIKVDPNFAQPYYLLGITYRSLGDEQNATFYLDKYDKMKK